VIEFLAVFWVARHNGQIAQAKGISPTRYQRGTAGLWFGMEALGVLLGVVVLGQRAPALGLYTFGLVGAIGGAVLSTYWTDQAPPAAGLQGHAVGAWNPTHVAPASGLYAWDSRDATQAPTAAIPPGTALVLSEVQGEWARVRGFNGWVGWVNGALLEPLPRARAQAG
jgi:hypothetical protein